MNSDDFKELIGAFIAETQEFLQLIEGHLLAMEQTNIHQRQAAVKEMFRAAHSIKGSAAMMGFQSLSAVAHGLEDCFAILRDRADLSALETTTVTALLQGVDLLRHLTDECTQSSAEVPVATDSQLQAIAEIKVQLETLYSRPQALQVSPVPVAGETLKLIFQSELPPVFDRLETELSQASDSTLASSVSAIDRIYYQLSGIAGMLQLPELQQLAEGLRELIDRPDLTVPQLQSTGWAVAQSLQILRTQILEGQAVALPSLEETPASSQTDAEAIPPTTKDEAVTGSPPPSSPIPNLQRPSIRVDLERLTELVNLVGELVINRTNLELQESQLRSEVRRIRRSILELNHFRSQLQEEYDRLLIARKPNHSSSLPILNGDLPLLTPEANTTPQETLPFPIHSPSLHAFDALELDQYTEFHATASEAIETTEAIAHSATKLDGLATQFERSTDQLRRITEQLRSRVMQLRVVNFSRAVDHLPRALREMCLTYHKDVNLLLLGRDTKIDESLLDALRDPLVQLVRNAFDHGIEPPEVRLALGKPASGQIEIEARHQGGQTIVTITDDGRGIDPEAIRRKVVEKGLATQEQAQDFAIAELYEFLFLPGFSTADRVNDLSGRGVGLDVVKANLRSVRGTVKVDSRPGKGTSFILKLPLMLSIADALMVRTDHNTVAIPLDAVEEILQIQAPQVQMAGHQPMLWWREEFIRLVRLQDLLHYSIPHPDGPSPDPLGQDYIPVLVLASSEGVLAVAVERALGLQEIVVKPLPPPLSKPRGVLGSTILGDGQVVSIIDVDDLVSQAQGQSTAVVMSDRGLLPPSSSQAPQILVVDDSYTIRHLLSLTLTRARYRVLQAKDGLDALEKLQNGVDCSLVIADIEMPRMDGFELLRSLKTTPQFAQIPVAMLTSRSGAKHRQMALELGAQQYFTKPYSEVQLLEAVSQLLKGSFGV
ncbi:MAG: response regulator [Actinomycetota bacterium]